MKQVFQVGEGFKVPDGTFVHSALDPRSAATNGERLEPFKVIWKMPW
jgi:hypothetical protein